MSGGVLTKPGEPGQGEAVKAQAECRKFGRGWRCPPQLPTQLEPKRRGWDDRGLKPHKGAEPSFPRHRIGASKETIVN